VDAEAGVFTQRLKVLIQRKYRSLDGSTRQTDFSKGHLSEISGKGSPSVATLTKIAKALEVEMRTFSSPGSRGTAPKRSSFLMPPNARRGIGGRAASRRGAEGGAVAVKGIPARPHPHC